MTFQDGRELSDITTGSTPLHIPAPLDDFDPLAEGQRELPALQFDPSEFMQYVQHQNLSDKEAHMLLSEVWKIIVAFADLGYGFHPIQQVRDNSAETDVDVAADSTAVVSSKNEFSQATKRPAVARPKRRARPRRDS